LLKIIYSNLILLERKEYFMNTFSAVIHKEDNLYVAECPEIGTASQGETIEEAVKNLQEATELFLKNSL
jgi:predicted RNase H-like HicB family nuclease